MIWKKYPSVSEGGKPFFLVGYNTERNRQASIVWNKQYKAYSIEFHGMDLGIANTLKEGKAVIKRREVK